MESQVISFIPLDIAIKYYKRWDSYIDIKQTQKGLFKCLEGTGIIQLKNGCQYQGTLFNGLMHGTGKFTWKDGLKYSGSFQNNQINGYGNYQWKNGSYYEGQVLKGKRHGKGKYFCNQNQCIYEGYWRNGLKQGKGKMIFSNGTIYEGEFKAGNRQGWGKIRYSSGNQYQGEWFHDKKQGKGTMSWHKVHEQYVGNWKNNQHHGLGCYYWFDGKIDYKTIKSVFKGSWQAGSREGLGALYYANGCKYQGYFQENLKNGVAISTNEFGQIKIQQYKADRPCLSKKNINACFSFNSGDKKIKLNDEIIKLQRINQSIQNQYKRMIYLKDNRINNDIYNLLLRYNSSLRNWYKTLGTGLHISNQPQYTGMTLQNLWKLLKDIKFIDEEISLARIDRCFYKGYNSDFEIKLPQKQRINIFLANQQLLKFNLESSLQWTKYANLINSQQINNFSDQVNILLQLINNKFNIHQGKSIILFRHFICYLICLALLKNQQEPNISIRKNFQIILQAIQNHIKQINKNQKSFISTGQLTAISTNIKNFVISDKYTKINTKVINQLVFSRKTQIQIQERTVSVRVFFGVLERTGILKENIEKLLFLQKIERNMNVSINLLKKDMKQYYGIIAPLVNICPLFDPIMNYELLDKDLNELLFQTLSRKISNTHTEEEYQNKYTQWTKLIIEDIYKSSLSQIKKKIIRKKINTQKSQDKIKMLGKKKIREIELMLIQKKLKEQKLEERELILMSKEDKNIQISSDCQSLESYFE